MPHLTGTSSHLPNTLMPPAWQATSSCLVIGYGNTLRGDDGVGPRIADVVETWQVKGVRSRSVHQLTPELAEEIAQVDTVIFVDASLNSSDNIPIHMQPIMAPDADWNRFSSMLHTYHPTSLLALVKLLYQKQPHAYVVMIPALNLELGENLSPLAQEGMAIALHILQDWLHNPTPSPK